MRKTMGVVLFGVASLMVSAGLSAQTNKPVDMSKLKAGQTTYNAMVAEYGKPENLSIDSDGSRDAVWIYDPTAQAPVKKTGFLGRILGGAVSRTRDLVGSSAGEAASKPFGYSSDAGQVVGGSVGSEVNKSVRNAGTETASSGQGRKATCSIAFDRHSRYVDGHCNYD